MRFSRTKKQGDVPVAGEKEGSAARNKSDDVEAAHVEPAVEEIDPVVEKRVRRKLDLHIVPLLSALYLLAFLDRSNIGCVSSHQGHCHVHC